MCFGCTISSLLFSHTTPNCCLSSRETFKTYSLHLLIFLALYLFHRGWNCGWWALFWGVLYRNKLPLWSVWLLKFTYVSYIYFITQLDVHISLFYLRYFYLWQLKSRLTHQILTSVFFPMELHFCEIKTSSFLLSSFALFLCIYIIYALCLLIIWVNKHSEK